MTRTYAIKRLLEHGPMELADIADCTGWGRGAVKCALRHCLQAGTVRRVPTASRFRFQYEAVL